jgi:hypothetical protein
MNHYYRVFFLLFAGIAISVNVHSQLCIGAGFGTFHIPGASDPFRVFGPTLRIEHLPENGRCVPYLDISYFSKSEPEGTTELYNANGMPIGAASVTTKFSYIYNQLGFKCLLGSDPDEKKVVPYIGGGMAFIYARQSTSFLSTVNAPDNVQGSFLYGFHFNAGIQYNVKAVVLELRGNLDIILKPLVDAESNILTNLRLSVTVPITKY